MGVEIRVEGLTKRFGRQTIWEDVTLTLPNGEISVLLGPSGTGKSVFLKTLIGLLKPNAGHIWIGDKDITRVSEHELYETRKLFGVLFQDGALFGSQNLFDNIAFPLREHTKKREGEIKSIVMEKIEMVGLLGAETKLPGEISGGMRKRAGLARALVLDPEIILCDEPDSGLDPVRTAYLNQLIVDLNAQIGATFLIVTHDINTARTVPDNIGLLFRRNLAMFGPRLQLLTSPEPVVRQFLNGRREGPIGMAEEKDAALLAAEAQTSTMPDLPAIEPQLVPSNGEPRASQRGPALEHRMSVEDTRQMLLDAGGELAPSGTILLRDIRLPGAPGRGPDRAAAATAAAPAVTAAGSGVTVLPAPEAAPVGVAPAQPAAGPAVAPDADAPVSPVRRGTAPTPVRSVRAPRPAATSAQPGRGASPTAPADAADAPRPRPSTARKRAS